MILSRSINAVNLICRIRRVRQILSCNNYKIVVRSLHRRGKFLRLHKLIFSSRKMISSFHTSALLYFNRFFQIFPIAVNDCACIEYYSFKYRNRTEIHHLMQINGQILFPAKLCEPFRTIIPARRGVKNPAALIKCHQNQRFDAARNFFNGNRPENRALNQVCAHDI